MVFLNDSKTVSFQNGLTVSASRYHVCCSPIALPAAILTTGPNDLMTKIHNRMPAILDDGEAKRWLTPGPITAEQVAELTTPHSADDMEAIPISSLVNRPENDVPEVLEPVAFVRPPAPPPALPEQIQGELF